jgi:hypothetical protein
MNLKIKKGIIIGFMVILLLSSYPTITCTVIKSAEDTEPLNDIPKINVTLPDVHLYSNESKFRYADVEFNDNGTVIDINISNISSDAIKLGFYQNTYLHVNNQIISNWIVTYTAIYKNDTLLINVESNGKIESSNDWHFNKTNMLFIWNISKWGLGEFSIKVIIVGVPPWLPFLHWLHLFFDLPDLLGYFPLPNVEIKGGTVNYQANIHI